MGEKHIDLYRFKKAQEEYYDIALREIKNGRKESCWMWFIFPQFKGLGYSQMAKHYEIQSIDEAEAFLMDKTLGTRLLRMCHELMLLPSRDAYSIFGKIDGDKLKSSMTLFYMTSKLEIFEDVLDKYFDGGMCEFTFNELKREHRSMHV